MEGDGPPEKSWKQRFQIGDKVQVTVPDPADTTVNTVYGTVLAVTCGGPADTPNVLYEVKPEGLADQQTLQKVNQLFISRDLRNKTTPRWSATAPELTLHPVHWRKFDEAGHPTKLTQGVYLWEELLVGCAPHKDLWQFPVLVELKQQPDVLFYVPFYISEYHAGGGKTRGQWRREFWGVQGTLSAAKQFVVLDVSQVETIHVGDIQRAVGQAHIETVNPKLQPLNVKEYLKSTWLERWMYRSVKREHAKEAKREACDSFKEEQLEENEQKRQKVQTTSPTSPVSSNSPIGKSSLSEPGPLCAMLQAVTSGAVYGATTALLHAGYRP
eukprot:TRINITY_DN63723_c0_g1_i1.p1 TRINITY_DN63723_c0_g1~~TRINITY_DN63723_c0_g1_i1.p1  ORF type:complete len:327 (+),score=33.10 TRINITY_DN63723_c0_g1_i1:71-1051(+)